MRHPLLLVGTALLSLAATHPQAEGDWGSIPGLGRSHGEGKGYPLQYFVPFPLPTPLSGFWGSSRHGCGLGQAGLAQRPSGILPCLAQVLAGGGKPRNWSPSSMAPHPAVSGACSKTSLGTRQQDGRQPSGSVATGVAGDSSDLAWASGLALAARKPTPSTHPWPQVLQGRRAL